MQFDFRYQGHSRVASTASSSTMTFQPDLSRDPVWFHGTISRRLPFREAISALHDVVISDLRFKPKDRTAYLEWRRQQDEVDWVEVARSRGDLEARIQPLREELNGLYQSRMTRMRPFYDARQRYFSYLWKHAKEAWWVLDPVVTVHPDEVFFEAFSDDESSYGRLGASHEIFDHLGGFSCGTTNVDYSEALYDAFQKIRDYKQTALTVDPGGFEVQTDTDPGHREVKIDLPDSWVRGFLQVSSAMTLPGARFELHPMDVASLCTVLRRRKERRGPRSLRFFLKPGEPVAVEIEPFGQRLSFARSRYDGHEPREIRVWGRRRLHILERLIPVARRFTVHLLGSGMPSFWLADLGPLRFTLGLSGWTANDWSRSGNFDLLASREHVDVGTKQKVFEALGDTWMATPGALAARLDLDEAIVHSALGGWVQAGRAMYDLEQGVYRKRELARDPLPVDALRFDSPQEADAARLLASGAVSIETDSHREGLRTLSAKVRDGSRTHDTLAVIDTDLRLRDGRCTCNHYVQNKLKRGPCSHLLALRLASRQVSGGYA